MVVVAAGIRPNAELAAARGLDVERGIVVDDQMRSVDDPDIYAVGECAQHRGEVYGLVAPLWEQAKVLADHLTGPTRTPRTTARGPRRSSRSPASTWPRWASSSPERDDDEFVVFAEPRRGVYKTSSSATAGWSAPPCSATSARSRS